MVTCNSCGSAVADGVAVCSHCGLAVAGHAPSAAGSEPAARTRQRGVGPVVTVIGAVLIAALAGATGLLAWDRYQHGDSTAPSAATPPVSVTATLGVADRDLVRELSPAHFENCTPEQRPIRFVTAAVNCDLVRLERTAVLVLRFTGASAMDDFTVPPSETVEGNDCAAGRSYTSWDSELGVERGLLSCWETADGTAWIAWSTYSTNIVMVATGTDLNAMYEWWQEGGFPDHA